MTRFKTEKEFQKFLDEAQICLCGKLLTGLHETYCQRIRKEWLRLRKVNQKQEQKK